MLLLREQGKLNVTEIAKRLHFAQPTTSQHLRILKEAGAIRAEKQAQQVYYTICNQQICDTLNNYIKLMASSPKTKANY